MMPPWLSKRVVFRLLFFTMILTVFPFLYVNYEARNPCRYDVKTDGCILTVGHASHPSYGGSVLRNNHLAFSKEHVQLQGNHKPVSPTLRNEWKTKEWKKTVARYSALFQTLMKKDLLKPGWKVLCIGAGEGQPVIALRENGVEDAIGIDNVPFPPLVMYGDFHKQPFLDNEFDFEYSDVFNLVSSPVLFLSEISRTLKPGGIAVFHVPCDMSESSVVSNPCTGSHFLMLFDDIKGLHMESLEKMDGRLELTVRKSHKSAEISLPKGYSSADQWHSKGNCSVSPQKLQAIAKSEPLIVDEPRKPWITLKQNVKNIVYLPDIVDISSYRRHIYVDVGARNYGSSIGSWFKKRYPKQNQKFQIFAIEADSSFEAGYQNRKDVTLLPYAAWIRNESLIFGDPKPLLKGAGMGRIQPAIPATNGLKDGKTSIGSKETQNSLKTVQALDFPAWLLQTASLHDYVVVKMDIEGTEFDLLPKMFKTGAICLVDELFLECHYNRWQRCCPDRTDKYKRTYSDCLQLFRGLRASGVLVHQWF